MIEVLAVASEVFPLVKTGGLADVVGALPAAMTPHGVEMAVMIPGYPAVQAALGPASAVLEYDDLFGGRATLRRGSAAGLSVLALDAPHLFDRAGDPYLGPDGTDWPDNWKRFAALGRAAADVGAGAVPAFAPAIVHAHDWQASLAAAYLHFGGRSAAKTVVTIHNLAFQGSFPPSIFGQLGLPAHAYGLDGVEFYGKVSYLKAGLQFADAITTVSPSYAEEIMTPSGGMGLDGLLRKRATVVSGILNGIDLAVWDPATDPHLPANYSATRLGRRAPNKRAIEVRFGLDAGDGPLFCVISRLTLQKGMDILADGIDALVAGGGRLAVLGSGDAALEGLLGAAAARHHGRVAMLNERSEPLAHLLQGGADAILVPSRFEPCGLTQFCGLRYGAVPIVSRVGGLGDSIIDANAAALGAGVATGIQFFPVDAPHLTRAVAQATSLYADKDAWANVQRRGMKADVSWGASSVRYAKLYEALAFPSAAPDIHHVPAP